MKFDRVANERREDAVIRNLLKGPPVIVVIFGEGHGFSDNIRRLEQRVEYVRVRLEGR